MTAEKKQEFTRKITQANSTDMVVIIYDISLSYLDEAQTAINDCDKAELGRVTVKIRKCINELIGSLNLEYSPAGEMLALYIFCSRQLVIMNRDSSIEALNSIKSILSQLREAYAAIAYANPAGPVMSNSQSVYAGLTYGRGSLNESVIESDNRGFLA